LIIVSNAAEVHFDSVTIQSIDRSTVSILQLEGGDSVYMKDFTLECSSEDLTATYAKTLIQDDTLYLQSPITISNIDEVIFDTCTFKNCYHSYQGIICSVYFN
jgi:hypothetical protein